MNGNDTTHRPAMASRSHQPQLRHEQGHYYGEDEYILVSMSEATFERYLSGYLLGTYGDAPATQQERNAATTHLMRVRYWHECQDPSNVHIQRKMGGGARAYWQD